MSHLDIPDFDQLAPTIRNLPSGPLAREQILIDQFRLHKQLFEKGGRSTKVEVYFMPALAPRPDAKIFLIGITPGWTQLELAYRWTSHWLKLGKSSAEARQLAAAQCSYAGSMRKNLVSMLDGLGLHEVLGVKSTLDLFSQEFAQLAFTTSALKHAVFVNEKNFTGHDKRVMGSEAIGSMIEEILVPEIQAHPKALLIPLGDFVSEVLDKLAQRRLVEEGRCLAGFPHPSGANGHRSVQYRDRKDKLEGLVRRWSLDS